MDFKEELKKEIEKIKGQKETILNLPKYEELIEVTEKRAVINIFNFKKVKEISEMIQIKIRPVEVFEREMNCLSYIIDKDIYMWLNDLKAKYTEEKGYLKAIFTYNDILCSFPIHRLVVMFEDIKRFGLFEADMIRKIVTNHNRIYRKGNVFNIDHLGKFAFNTGNFKNNISNNLKYNLYYIKKGLNLKKGNGLDKEQDIELDYYDDHILITKIKGNKKITYSKKLIDIDHSTVNTTIVTTIQRAEEISKILENYNKELYYGLEIVEKELNKEEKELQRVGINPSHI